MARKKLQSSKFLTRIILKITSKRKYLNRPTNWQYAAFQLLVLIVSNSSFPFATVTAHESRFSTISDLSYPKQFGYVILWLYSLLTWYDLLHCIITSLLISQYTYPHPSLFPISSGPNFCIEFQHPPQSSRVVPTQFCVPLLAAKRYKKNKVCFILNPKTK